MSSTNRVHSADLLRGFLAAAVMFYHIAYLKGFDLEIIAYYAVYGFFVLSGFSLYITYPSLDLRRYAIRRLFRIAPLWWLALSVSLFLAPSLLSRWTDVIYNATLTFGLVSPGASSLVGGGWSIGIEIIYYLLFPILALAPISAAVLFIPLMFAFANVVLSGRCTMLEPGAWAAYTQPIAFLGYFCFGLALGKLYLTCPWLKGYGWLILPLSVAPFFLIQTKCPTALLVGSTGLILAASTMLLVTGAVFSPEPPSALAAWLGNISYSVYLLHPFFLSHGWLAAPLTLAAATLVYYTYERPLRRLGRAIA